MARSNLQPWGKTGKEEILLEIKRRKWKLIGHSLRKRKEWQNASDWKPQGNRSGVRPRKTRKRAIEEEALEDGKKVNGVKKLTEKRVPLVALWGCRMLLLGATRIMMIQSVVTI
jgi:hypothetical protein